MTRSLVRLAQLLLLAAAVASAQQVRQVQDAICVLQGTENRPDVSGEITFKRNGNNLEVSYTVCGLVPSATHDYHVHEFGNVFLPDGLSTSGHFIGQCNGCRNGEVGHPDDNMVADGTGCATNQYTDSVMKLNGVNSIVGRSVVIHDPTTPSTRIAQCVIGRDDDRTTEAASPLITEELFATPRRAHCELQATGNNPRQVTGFMEFEDSSSGVVMRYFVEGLGDGQSAHNIHVHEIGNIRDMAGGTSTGGHFIGDCTMCRPDGALQEVGNIDGGYQVRSFNSYASGYLTDDVLQLSGVNSIIGRSIVIHDAVDSSLRIAQCVIGLAAEGDAPTFTSASVSNIPLVTSATTVLRAVSPSPILEPMPLSGYIQFDRMPDNMNVMVTYVITGLPPGPHAWHVHALGDLCNDNGQSVTGHFIGDCNSCRTGSPSDEVGQLNDNTPIVANDDGVAKGVFVDDVIRLEGVNSIVGRSIVVHGNGTMGSSAYIAVGDIGRATEHATLFGDDIPAVSSASCRLQATRENPNADLDGYVAFFLDDSTGFMTVKYNITGLAAGPHGWHVHDFGNIIGDDMALATGGHFVGTLTFPRPDGALQEVGLIDDGEPILADANGHAYGVFRDRNIQLNGINTIVGRSIVIHGDGVSSGVRVAQCVIGSSSFDSMITTNPPCDERLDEEFLFTTQVEEAVCVLRGTDANPTATGSFNFRWNEFEHTITVSYDFCGLFAEGELPVHVHEFGDIFNPDVSSTGGHFVGDCFNCRPGGALQEVGLLDNGMRIVTDASGCATGSFNDTEIQFDNINSIIGRSVVVHNPTGGRIAQCVIGRDDARAVEAAAQLAARAPTFSRATCTFERATQHPMNAGGYMTFTSTNASDPDASVIVHGYVWGLDDGDHQVHVHEEGNIGDTVAATETGGHFIGFRGACGTPCRTTGLAEIGNIGNGYLITAAAGTANVWLEDQFIKLNGRNSIVGRSVVVHAPGTGDRIMQCVIGVDQEGPVVLPEPDMIRNQERIVPYVTRAAAVLEPTGLETSANPNTPNVGGYVEFILEPSTAFIQVKALVSGLSQGAHAWEIRENGNLCEFSGSFTGAQLIGDCMMCRPNNGSLGDVLDGRALIASSDGVAVLEGIDQYLAFNYTNSIIGRSVVIYTGATTDTPIAAIGAIGRSEERTDVLLYDVPTIQHASCRIQPTLQPGLAGIDDIDGFISLTADFDHGSVRVAYSITGLPPGDHPWHVHDFGDVLDEKFALSTGGHFIGTLSVPRPDGVAQEVGAIDDGRDLIAASTEQAFGEFEDFQLRLNGFNSIVGRSIVIHAGPNDGRRIAQCTIGVAREEPNTAFPTCPLLVEDPPSATCELQATTENGRDVSGRITIVELNGDYKVTWNVCGLSEGSHTWAIHQYGDVFTTDGSGAGDVFVGDCASCRPSANNQVGNLASSTPMVVDPGANCTTGTFFDTVVRLTGVNSVIGRTFVINGNSGSPTARVAQCVIGRADFVSTGSDTPANYPKVRKASCALQQTRLSPGPGGGYMTFEEVEGGLNIRWVSHGLPIGPHEFHVHTQGDLSDPFGLSTEGHFLGNCSDDNPCRPFGLQEVGNLGNGYDITANIEGFSSGQLLDLVAVLNGLDSIVGRGLIIHGDGPFTGPRVQMCVIGIVEEGDPPSAPVVSGGTVPLVTEAGCLLESTTNGFGVTGHVSLQLVPGTLDVQLQWVLRGLSPGMHPWHVHEYGDLCADDGSSTGGHFVGNCNSCRPSGAQEIGNINNGVGLVADENGISQGRLVDSVLTLMGENSILGRSIVVHGNSSSAGVRVAQCVIGRVRHHPTALQLAGPTDIGGASCRLERTYLLEPPQAGGDIDLRGYVGFTELSSTAFRVHYRVQNLPSGDHAWHVHEYGDIISEENALATGGHFIGTNPNRPAGTAQEVGNLNNGAPIVASDFGQAGGEFVDMGGLALSGVNSILGRSVVIHGDGNDAGVRIAQCVIGVTPNVTVCNLLNPVEEPVIVAPSDDGLSTNTILAISFGIIAAIAAVFILVLFVRGRRNSGNKFRKATSQIRQQGGETDAADVQITTTTGGTPSDKLPPGWVAYLDDAGHTYYFNESTQQTQWELPTNTSTAV